MISKTNLLIANAFDAVVEPYRNHAEQNQLAIAYYMSLNGEAWELPPALQAVDGWDNTAPHEQAKTLFRDNLDFYVRKYGSRKFGTVNIPTAVLKSAVMSRDYDIIRDWGGDWQAYHNWYVGMGHMPDHDVSKPLWPCVLSQMDEEVFEDGWHRFHDYCRKGVAVIPCVFFPRKEKR
jgi:hypothetical protein